jgi:hypothetical protein
MQADRDTGTILKDPPANFQLKNRGEKATMPISKERQQTGRMNTASLWISDHLSR